MAQRPSALKHLVNLTSPENVYRVLRRNKCLTEEALHNPHRIIEMIRMITEEKRARQEQELALGDSRFSPAELICGNSTVADEVANALYPYLNERGNAMFYQACSLSRWQIIKFKYL